MIDAGHGEVGTHRQPQRSEVALGIVSVAGLRIVGQRHELVPDLGDDRVQADSRADRTSPAANGWLVSHAVYGHRDGIQVVR